MIELLVFGAIFVFALYIIIVYNSLISKKVRVENAWSQIDVQLKKRYDLVPNLIETVKGYMKHEKELFENITKLRAQAINASDLKTKAKAEGELSATLKSIFAVAENYPNLKANENFLMLQEELSGIENKIAYARQFYNDSVLDYNTYLLSFPANIFANMFGFKQKEFFKAEEEEKKNVKVSFN
jgi:LemA protein